jgi:phage-related protein
MAIAMPLTAKISQDSTKSSSFNTLKSDLGNNIRQYTDSGLNSRRDVWNIVYNFVSKTELDTITTALDSVGSGRNQLVWTPWGESTSKEWTVTSAGYKIDVLGGDVFNVSFTMEEEH